jgi:hypothetical protein
MENIMYIVYKLTFKTRESTNTLPCYYIGSKSNCKVINGVIINEDGSEYWSSSKSSSFAESLSKELPEVEILYEGTSAKDVNQEENRLQRLVNADTSPYYFNQFVAPVNNFTWDNYGSFKHIDYPEKCCRLPLDHPLVLNRTYVGVTYGVRLTEEEKFKRYGDDFMIGEKNPFFGRTHSDETKKVLSEKRMGKDYRSSDQIDEWVANIAKKPKSAEHRSKIGRKGYIMLKSAITGETIRVLKEESVNYNPEEWKNPAAFKTGIPNGSKWCNNGSVNLKIKSTEELPLGYSYGRIMKRKSNENQIN